MACKQIILYGKSVSFLDDRQNKHLTRRENLEIIYRKRYSETCKIFSTDYSIKNHSKWWKPFYLMHIKIIKFMYVSVISQTYENMVCELPYFDVNQKMFKSIWYPKLLKLTKGNFRFEILKKIILEYHECKYPVITYQLRKIM